jgi:elongation factor Ts
VKDAKLYGSFMVKIDLDLVQKLRERTGVGMMDCRKALEETGGDLEKAVTILRRKGAAVAEKRSANDTTEGLVHVYIHAGAKMGVLVQINCETDFVARTDDLKKFANDICMHIAAFKPKYISPEDVDKTFVDQERAHYIEELVKSKKPANVIDQIVTGKLNKIYSSVCLLKQPFVKNDQLTVEDVLNELIAKMGENIKIRHFVRFEV